MCRSPSGWRSGQESQTRCSRGRRGAIWVPRAAMRPLVARERARSPAGAIPRPGPGDPCRSASECSLTASRAHHRLACNAGRFGGPQWLTTASVTITTKKRATATAGTKPAMMTSSTFVPRGPRLSRPRSQSARGASCSPGHGIPGLSVYDPYVRSGTPPLSLTVPLCRPIGQVLVQPSSRTARIDPMHPAIQAIPTFGTLSRCYQRSAGYNPTNAKYAARLDGMGGRDR